MLKLHIFAVVLFISCVYSEISVDKGPDGTYDLNEKLPLAGNDQNSLSAVGSLTGLKDGGGYDAVGGGLTFENANGHGLSFTGSHISNFGDQLSANGRLALVNTPDHKLNANAFLTRTMPNNPDLPDFNTHGGSVDYTFRDKLGASLGASYTPQFQKTDYSAMSSLNLFRDRTSSLDLNAGASRSFSPFIPKSSWEPTFGFQYKKSF